MLTLLHLRCSPWMNNIYLTGLDEGRVNTCHSSDPHEWQAGAFSVMMVIIHKHFRPLLKYKDITSTSDACLNTQTTVTVC